MQRAIEFLRAHLAETITLRQLAREIGLSAPHLSRLFRVQLGEPPGVVLKRMRMDLAAEALISERRLAVREVAYEVGYRSASHFAKAFVSVHGLTPAACRRQNIALARKAVVG